MDGSTSGSWVDPIVWDWHTPTSDGAYRCWADGEMIIERTGVDLRGSTSYEFNEVMLDTYWNGGSPVEQSRFYDNLVISTAPIGCAD